MARTKSGNGCTFALIVLVALVWVGARTCGGRSKPTPTREATPTLTASSVRTHGTAVYLLIDVSGSMSDRVANATGASEHKLAIAKRAAIDACNTIAKYAAEDPARNIRLAVASFSNDVTLILQMDKPDAAAAAAAINRLNTHGGTAIGDAVIEAQKGLDRTHLQGQHILLITDGENTAGKDPAAVADALNALPDTLRPTTYLIAFDINANVFAAVKEKGWQVFPAADGKQLQQQLDEVVGGKILIEK